MSQEKRQNNLEVGPYHRNVIVSCWEDVPKETASITKNCDHLFKAKSAIFNMKLSEVAQREKDMNEWMKQIIDYKSKAVCGDTSNRVGVLIACDVYLQTAREYLYHYDQAFVLAGERIPRPKRDIKDWPTTKDLTKHLAEGKGALVEYLMYEDNETFANFFWQDMIRKRYEEFAPENKTDRRYFATALPTSIQIGATRGSCAVRTIREIGDVIFQSIADPESDVEHGFDLFAYAIIPGKKVKVPIQIGTPRIPKKNAQIYLSDRRNNKVEPPYDTLEDVSIFFGINRKMYSGALGKPKPELIAYTDQRLKKEMLTYLLAKKTLEGENKNEKE
ncbi:MAG TPA: hypothetical protein VJ179_02630 [Patescibacteria group bacterium]|nr:hypothetical protein [Patescibacteria group bacterium]